LIRDLLGDLGVPLFFSAANFRAPMHMRVIELNDFLDARNEPREFLELRPLVVDRPNRAIDFHAAFYSFHFLSP
jgi:hypothetical protein